MALCVFGVNAYSDEINNKQNALKNKAKALDDKDGVLRNKIEVLDDKHDKLDKM